MLKIPVAVGYVLRNACFSQNNILMLLIWNMVIINKLRYDPFTLKCIYIFCQFFFYYQLLYGSQQGGRRTARGPQQTSKF